jgi:predicted O-methyltransferase YrrM
VGGDERFAEIVACVGETPWMAPHQGRRVWEHIRRTGATSVLDVGTCYGVSAAYMAAAVAANGGGRVVTVDSGQFDHRSEVPAWCVDLWDRCGVTELIEMVRIPHSNYAWWLMEQVAARSDVDGNCDPLYDFAYLDGAKWLTLDAAAVVFTAQLLRPGGWLLMDDLDWSYAEHPELAPVVDLPGAAVSYHLSDEEIRVPHLRAVFDLVVKHDPAFTEFLEQDGAWGWARKAPGEPRRLVLDVVRPGWVDQLRWLRAAVRRRRGGCGPVGS